MQNSEELATEALTIRAGSIFVVHIFHKGENALKFCNSLLEILDCSR